MSSSNRFEEDPNQDNESDEEAAAEIEEVTKGMENMRELLYGNKDREEAPMIKELEEKHRDYYWAPKACKGPAPTQSEWLRYRNDATAQRRFRGIDGASQRVFILELSGHDEYVDEHWCLLESAADDILTHRYAWVDIIIPNKTYSTKSLEAVRILLLYTNHLLANERYRNVSKALQVLNINRTFFHGASQTKLGGLLNTMKNDTGTDRFQLAIQEYKQELYCCIVMAVSGHRDEAIEFFQSGMTEEQGYRVQSRFEFKNRDMLSDPDDYQRMIVNLDGCVSLMWIVSEVLGIPREDLDETWDEFDEYPIGFAWDLEDEKIWQCIESLCDARIDENCMSEFCETCWTVTDDLKKCSRCKLVSYCSKKCQIESWSDHKHDCLGQKDNKNNKDE